MTIKVTFGVKKHEVKYNDKGFAPSERDYYELKTFFHECDDSKSYWENTCDAFEKAVSMGHEPNRNIRMQVVG